jgi:hypothetical protein
MVIAVLPPQVFIGGLPVFHLLGRRKELQLASCASSKNRDPITVFENRKFDFIHHNTASLVKIAQLFAALPLCRFSVIS